MDAGDLAQHCHRLFLGALEGVAADDAAMATVDDFARAGQPAGAQDAGPD